MSNYTDYLYMPTGGNYYAKAEPLNTGTWSTGVVAYTENGSTGSYAATLDSTTPYAVYQRAGASPTSSDTIVQFVPVNYLVDILSRLSSQPVMNGPVSPSGYVTSIIKGDDYLAANGNAFEWTIAAPTGYVAGTSTVKFGGKHVSDSTQSWLATGSITVNGSDWDLSIDLPSSATSSLTVGQYNWSVEITNADAQEKTVVKSNQPLRLLEKQT